jgi:hypothetical protein
MTSVINVLGTLSDASMCRIRRAGPGHWRGCSGLPGQVCRHIRRGNPGARGCLVSGPHLPLNDSKHWRNLGCLVRWLCSCRTTQVLGETLTLPCKMVYISAEERISWGFTGQKTGVSLQMTTLGTAFASSLCPLNCNHVDAVRGDACRGLFGYWAQTVQVQLPYVVHRAPEGMTIWWGC